MSDQPVEAETPTPTSQVCVSEEEAKKFNVGESVSLTVTGKVKSIMERYGKENKGKYDVTIENPSVAYDEAKVMDKQEMDAPGIKDKVKDMSADKLRERLPKADRSY